MNKLKIEQSEILEPFLVKKMILTNQQEWVINDVFESFFERYLIGLEPSMIWSDFISNSAQLLYYKCHKIIFKLGRSYIDSRDWIKKEKSNNKSEK